MEAVVKVVKVAGKIASRIIIWIAGKLEKGGSK